MKKILLIFVLCCVSASPANPPLASEAQEESNTDEVGDCQKGVETLKNDVLGLEFYLKDKKNHKEHCSSIKWEQPKLDEYKEEPKSYLPKDCVEILKE